jgi:TRAP-type C4-dicarboxylate transport system permease small subunit
VELLKKAWKIFEIVEEKLAKFAAGLAAIYILVAAIGISIAALGRYVFNFNIHGVDELSGYMLVFVTYMGLAYGLRTDSHINIDVVMKRFSAKVINIMQVACCIVGLCVIGIYLYYANASLIESIEIEEKALTMLETPLWIPRSVICIGWIVMGFSMIRLMVTRIMALR